MRRLRTIELLPLNIYWFGLSYFHNAMGPVIQPVLVAILVEEGIRGQAQGYLAALGLIIALIVQPLAGAWSDGVLTRWGRRHPFILAGTLLDMIFLALIGTAGNYWVLLLGVLLLQFASNLAHGPFQCLIPDLVPPEQRGRAVSVKQLLEILGVIVTSFAMAAFLGPQFSHLETRGQVWLALISIMGIISAAMLVTVLFVREDGTGAPTVRSPVRSFLSKIGAHMGQRPAVQRPFLLVLLGTRYFYRHAPDFVWWLVSRLFVLIGFNLVRNFAVLYLAYVLSIPAAEAGAQASTLVGIIGLAIMTVVLPAGYLADRLGRKPVNGVAGLLGILGALAFLLIRGQVLFRIAGFAFTDLLVAGGIVGLSVGIFLTANWALGTDLVPAKEAGLYLGLSNLATAGAGVIGNPLGGTLIDVFNAQQPGLGYTALYLAAALVFLVGTLLLAKVRETRPIAAPLRLPA